MHLYPALMRVPEVAATLKNQKFDFQESSGKFRTAFGRSTSSTQGARYSRGLLSVQKVVEY